jgi:hypothetical protein
MKTKSFHRMLQIITLAEFQESCCTLGGCKKSINLMFYHLAITNWQKNNNLSTKPVDTQSRMNIGWCRVSQECELIKENKTIIFKKLLILPNNPMMFGSFITRTTKYVIISFET